MNSLFSERLIFYVVRNLYSWPDNFQQELFENSWDQLLGFDDDLMTENVRVFLRTTVYRPL